MRSRCASQIPTKRYRSGCPKFETQVQPSRHFSVRSPGDRVSTWLDTVPPNLVEVPGLKEMFLQAQSMGCIDFKLPPKRATSGIVLQRALVSMESLFHRFYPMIYKFGYTHNCVYRWSNDMFGYTGERDGWTNMCVLYMADEPYSVAMLEAALVEKHHGILSVAAFCVSQKGCCVCRVYSSFVFSKFQTLYSLPHACSLEVSLAAGTSSLVGIQSSWSLQIGMPTCVMLCTDPLRRSPSRSISFHIHTCCLTSAWTIWETEWKISDSLWLCVVRTCDILHMG